MSLSQKEQVTTSDGVRVYFDRYVGGHSMVVIIAHGFFNSKESVLLKSLAQDLSGEYDCIVMDFRGHGETKGLFYWTTKEHLDLEAVLKFARQNYQKTAVIGFSLGAATSLIVASKSDLIDTVIAVSPPTVFEKIEFHFWNLDVENDIRYNLGKEGKIGKGVRPGPFWMPKEKPIKIVENVKAPICYIHGGADWLIHPWHSAALFEKTRSVKHIAIIKDGPHAEYLIRKNRDEFIRLVRDWLHQTLPQNEQKLF